MKILLGYTKGGKSWFPRFIVSIDKERCLGCGRCYRICGREVLTLVGNDDDDEAKVMAVMRSENCIGCEACFRACPRKIPVHEVAG